MFDRHTPIDIRTDPELLEEFPPLKLKGMCGGWLTWRIARNVEERSEDAAYDQRAHELRGLLGADRLLGTFARITPAEHERITGFGRLGIERRERIAGLPFEQTTGPCRLVVNINLNAKLFSFLQSQPPHRIGGASVKNSTAS